jgi:acetyl-CoA carboxylase biotin carboxyl carrier protein
MNDRESGQAKKTERQRGTSSLERGGPGRRPHRKRPSRPEASVNMGELRELIALARENGFAEFELEHEGFRVRWRREVESAGAENAPGGGDLAQAATEQPAQAAAAQSLRTPAENSAVAAPSHPGARAETAAHEDQDLYMIPSPIVGTFYRAASPNTESFVKIGSHVEPDTVVCIIEAMKLMNEIQAETTGEVAKIYVENGQPVEYGQPLFGIKN